VASVIRRDDAARWLRARAASTPIVAKLVTAPFWLLLIARGVLYPVFGADDLEHSWGGPTLLGAWAVHLLIGIALLAAVSVLLAMATRDAAASST